MLREDKGKGGCFSTRARGVTNAERLVLLLHAGYGTTPASYGTMYVSNRLL